MEHAAKGDLNQLIHFNKLKKTRIPEHLIWKYAFQLCSAVYYLHQQNIIHRDIKTKNIFLSYDGTLKLGDLGISKELKKGIEFQQSQVGTPLFVAPEMV